MYTLVLTYYQPVKIRSQISILKLLKWGSIKANRIFLWMHAKGRPIIDSNQNLKSSKIRPNFVDKESSKNKKLK